jgi:hypothetical protein
MQNLDHAVWRPCNVETMQCGVHAMWNHAVWRPCNVDTMQYGDHAMWRHYSEETMQYFEQAAKL